MVATFLFGGYLLWETARPAVMTDAADAPEESVPNQNVSESDGQQIIVIKAKGGYVPKVSVAKAGVPTLLRVNTAGTFDCSSQLRIPSLNITRSLAPSGVTDIDLGILEPGTLSGTCAMGMYPFEIRVQS